MPLTNTWYVSFIMVFGKETLQKPVDPCSPVALNFRDMTSGCSIQTGATKSEIVELEITVTFSVIRHDRRCEIARAKGRD